MTTSTNFTNFISFLQTPLPHPPPPPPPPTHTHTHTHNPKDGLNFCRCPLEKNSLRVDFSVCLPVYWIYIVAVYCLTSDWELVVSNCIVELFWDTAFTAYFKIGKKLTLQNSPAVFSQIYNTSPV